MRKEVIAVAFVAVPKIPGSVVKAISCQINRKHFHFHRLRLSLMTKKLSQKNLRAKAQEKIKNSKT